MTKSRGDDPVGGHCSWEDGWEYLDPSVLWVRYYPRALVLEELLRLDAYIADKWLK